MKKITPIYRGKGYVKPIAVDIYKTDYTEVEYWKIDEVAAEYIEGKLSILRMKLNEIIEHINKEEKRR